MRVILSLSVIACLYHREFWIDDGAGDGQSAQVRGTSGMALTRGCYSVPLPASLFFFLFVFGLLFCLKAILELDAQMGAAGTSASDPQPCGH